MNLAAIPLEIFGVYDRGVPNLERIVLRSTGQADLRSYYMMLGARVPLSSDRILPLPDQCLWLGERVVAPNSWVFVYTGSGTDIVTTENHTKQPLQAIFWHKPSVVLSNPDVIPFLVTSAYLEIGNRPNKSVADIQSNAQELDSSVNQFAKLLADMQKP